MYINQQTGVCFPHWYALHLHPLPAFHYRFFEMFSCISFVSLFFFFFFCFCVSVDSFIETHSVFVCALSLPPSPLPHTRDEQPVKVKRKKSFNLSRKFPFYKSKENIVQELVESEREYLLCHQWGLCFYFLFFFFVLFLSMLQFALSPFISPLQGCLECWHHSHPCLRDAPHDTGDVGHLCGVSVCVCGLQRRVQLCMCAPGCINISYPMLMLLLLEVMINSSVTSPQQESH